MSGVLPQSMKYLSLVSLCVLYVCLLEEHPNKAHILLEKTDKEIEINTSVLLAFMSYVHRSL